eukprot:COSAG05_NODE_500_length_9234_cov_107.281664_8_plen_60_part_00
MRARMVDDSSTCRELIAQPSHAVDKLHLGDAPRVICVGATEGHFERVPDIIGNLETMHD